MSDTVTERFVAERPVTERFVAERPVIERFVTERSITERSVTERFITRSAVLDEAIVGGSWEVGGEASMLSRTGIFHVLFTFILSH